MTVLIGMLRLAEELGAKSVTIPGSSIAETVINCVQNQNITKIIIGKSRRSNLVYCYAAQLPTN